MQATIAPQRNATVKLFMLLSPYEREGYGEDGKILVESLYEAGHEIIVETVVVDVAFVGAPCAETTVACPNKSCPFR